MSRMRCVRIATESGPVLEVMREWDNVRERLSAQRVVREESAKLPGVMLAAEWERTFGRGEPEWRRFFWLGGRRDDAAEQAAVGPDPAGGAEGDG
jgi:hypothetical protein